MSQEIQLTKGKVAIVDDADYEWLIRFSWCYGNNGYAVATIDGENITMHRLLMNPPDGMYVDHINGDTLCNTRQNLRIVTPRQSNQNSASRRGSSSVFRGVSRSRDKWQAKIVADGKDINLGRYSTQREAAAAYNEAAKIHFGEYARLNDLSILAPEDDLPLPERPTASKYTGVFADLRRNAWIASIMVNRENHYLGQFDTDEEAARAYDNFVRTHNLKRKLNFPD